MRKLLIILVLSVSSLFAEDKVIRWAADAESGAPYVFQNPKNPSVLIGFEVDIMKLISKETGYKLKFVQNQWDGLVPGLDRGDYDVAINGIEITEDRKLEVNFSIPYYKTYQQITVREDENNIKSMDDLVGKKCGTLGASLAERMLRAHGGIDVVIYEDEINSYSDLENERIDAVLLDHPIAVYYASWNSQLKLVGEPIGEVIYGIAISKENTQMLREINAAISTISENGELRRILEEWNMWNIKMAEYIGDYSSQNIKPIHYEEYLETQGKSLSFKDRIERYISFLPLMGQAAWLTIKLTVISMLLAIVFGLILALTRVYAPRPISMIAIGYIELIRGTPLLIQLFFIFYALPTIGIKLSPFVAAILGLGLNYAAYEAENYRAGIFSVARGQMEAAISLGMTRFQAIRYIIIPQALRLVIPPITNDFISLLKDSSLVSIITLRELTKLYGQLSSVYYDYIGTGIMIAVIYLLLGLPFVKLSKLAERRFSLDKSKVSL